MKRSKFIFLLMLVAIASILTSIHKISNTEKNLNSALKEVSHGDFSYNAVIDINSINGLDPNKLTSLLDKHLSNFSVELHLQSSKISTTDNLNLIGILNNRTYLGTTDFTAYEFETSKDVIYANDNYEDFKTKSIYINNTPHRVISSYKNSYRKGLYYSLNHMPYDIAKLFSRDVSFTLTVRSNSRFDNNLDSFLKDLHSLDKDIASSKTLFSNETYDSSKHFIKVTHSEKEKPYIAMLVFSIALISFLIIKIFFNCSKYIYGSLLIIMMTVLGYLSIGAYTYLNSSLKFSSIIEDYKDTPIYYSTIGLNTPMENRVSAVTANDVIVSFSSKLSEEKSLKLQDDLNFYLPFNKPSNGYVMSRYFYYPEEFIDVLNIELSEGSNLYEDSNEDGNNILMGDIYKSYFDLGDKIQIDGNTFNIVGFIKKDIFVPYNLGRLNNTNNLIISSSAPKNYQGVNNDLLLTKEPVEGYENISSYSINKSLSRSYLSAKFIYILFALVTFALICITIMSCYANLLVFVRTVTFAAFAFMSSLIGMFLFYIFNINGSTLLSIFPVESLEVINTYGIMFTIALTVALIIFQYLYKRLLIHFKNNPEKYKRLFR